MVFIDKVTECLCIEIFIVCSDLTIYLHNMQAHPIETKCPIITYMQMVDHNISTNKDSICSGGTTKDH